VTYPDGDISQSVGSHAAPDYRGVANLDVCLRVIREMTTRRPTKSKGAMTTCNRFHHTGYTVADLGRSISFYRDLLGCQVISVSERHGGYFAEVVGYPDAYVRMAHLRLPDGDHLLELFQYLAPAGETLSISRCTVGSAHIALVVDDLPALYETLRTAGVSSFVSPPVAIDTGTNAGGFALYLLDPDGITVELFQPPREAGPD
jgi:catechol 2,3-dioxygenase-like lactoylglutathione lyase family enzyme